ncbi:N-acetylmuramoyl-L-alanine amidase [Pigmentibacter sp. JX0631]|uniref:N-acetylmuramoyl-L-alanine amidase n=1 Tax=Pigmentibacter sp. JX0631 TaxID=2976982 RepID=UPI002468D0EF|nr:N-acetylmuramoyl-L-alanine amidase [Pigmentibacter sp. JX0631]WGL58611.1 N-acetylmuramoyl-L-alanine amidase [Pigmentibacter sp. JX0631]
MKKFNYLIPVFSLLAISCGKSNNDSDKNKSEYTVNNKYEFKDTPSKGFNDRISALVFHYTALDQDKSLETLIKGNVSAHWLIPESGNTVYKLVSEDKRSYHAGISSWKRRSDLNDTSVGIEIVNLGYTCINNPKSDQCPKNEKKWYKYTDDQISMILNLAKDIQNRYKIDPLCVVGHSDIAVGRKVDPGPYFPWQQLANAGVGAWVTEDEIQQQLKLIQNSISDDITTFTLQTRLYEFGYDIRNSNYTDKFIDNELTKKIFPEFSDTDSKIKNWKSIPFDNLVLLNKLNTYSSKNTTDAINIKDIFDINLTMSAIDAFAMHFLPEEFLSNEVADNKKLLATIQALLIKYPNRAKSGCGY